MNIKKMNNMDIIIGIVFFGLLVGVLSKIVRSESSFVLPQALQINMESFRGGSSDKKDSVYEKVNGLDYIVWINLERSEKRRKHMEENMSHISVPNERIEAIDGKMEDMDTYFLNTDIRPRMTDSEIACTLSHLKAIHTLQSKPGNYFLILEDDVIFDNLATIPYDLREIIEMSPSFDILQIFTLRTNEQTFLFSNWVKYNDWSTGAYIINRKGINRIVKRYPMVDGIFLFPMSELKGADTFIYENANTITFKYNCLDALEEESTIHTSHLKNHRSAIFIQREIMKRDFGHL